VNCPSQFQQYIPGTDFRVHVVGDEVFSCEIRSEADDYRYAAPGLASAQVRSATLPKDLAERCTAASSAMGLQVSGIDFRRAQWDEWFCLEINPSPGFTFYESATGQRIAAAIAGLLSSGSRQAVSGSRIEPIGVGKGLEKGLV
jgi:glutathione synthase/RimK-type ligase-like ATP-grasp enzyme